MAVLGAFTIKHCKRTFLSYLEIGCPSDIDMFFRIVNLSFIFIMFYPYFKMEYYHAFCNILGQFNMSLDIETFLWALIFLSWGLTCSYSKDDNHPSCDEKHITAMSFQLLITLYNMI